MTFYFFDLETSGFSPRDDRIMQFAGQRTDMDLNPIGEPDNILIKITPDVLPQPDAVLIHGITPQKTIADGISESAFVKHLSSRVFNKDTIAVGYNNIRFDNEFIRFTLWRNFSDAYEWSWKNGCSTWDLLDATRMTRALRPEGLNWPFAPDGKPTNSLEYLTSVNKLDHVDAHDALSDVRALVDWASLLKAKQPQLFDYLLNIRSKKEAARLVTAGRPLVYTSGRYPSEFHKTAVVAMIAELPDQSGALMYDLRIDPDEFQDFSPAELARRWKDRDENAPYFPVKLLKYNHCPAIAPLEVLTKADGYERLKLHKEIVKNHLEKLVIAKGLGDRLLEAQENLWPKRQAALVDDPQKVDGRLYDGFIDDEDKTKMGVIRAAAPNQLAKLDLRFKDSRLNSLLALYKARNYPKTLGQAEQKSWADFRFHKLVSSGKADNFFKRLEELAKTPGLGGQKQYLLEELNLYAQSVLPTAAE